MVDPRILILTPIRNEEHSLPYYLESLTNIDYPSELIDVFWLENDSSDRTLKMLKAAKPKMPFRSTTLRTINILGKTKKQPPGKYVKDIPFGIKKRVAPWIVIWNDHFIPLVEKSEAPYVLTWFADAAAPPNAIRDFLEVFSKKKDAGWVGGANYRRYPRHNDLGCPRPFHLAKSHKVVEVDWIGHVWMSPRSLLAKTQMSYAAPDVHCSIIKQMRNRGFKVYYQPRVFLHHVATDGIIHRTEPDWALIKPENMPSSHYDEIYEKNQKYLIPAKYSPYKVVWNKVLKRLPSSCSILDVGCGPGQFATICVKAGHSYVGVDFSKQAINRGRHIVPEATFHLVDIVKDKSLLTKGDYDVATFIEFFEHIEEDLEVLESVPEGKKVVLTVPKFWCKGHVRVFGAPNDVYTRYGSLIDIKFFNTVAFGKHSKKFLGPYGPRKYGQWTIYIVSGTRQKVK